MHENVLVNEVQIALKQDGALTVSQDTLRGAWGTTDNAELAGHLDRMCRGHDWTWDCSETGDFYIIMTAPAPSSTVTSNTPAFPGTRATSPSSASNVVSNS